MTPGDLILLPGGLLGRIRSVDGDGVPYVDRWSTADPPGWRLFGREARALPSGDVREHHNYQAAWEKRGEKAE